MGKLQSTRCEMRRHRARLARQLRHMFEWQGPRFPPLKMA
jgi:hypothetical protein